LHACNRGTLLPDPYSFLKAALVPHKSHACTRGTLLPDPRYDALRCVVLAAADDAEDMGGAGLTARVLIHDDKDLLINRDGLPNVQARMPLLCSPAALPPPESFPRPHLNRVRIIELALKLN
jgi:hypothetical protein